MRQLTNGEVNRPVLVFSFNQNRWHSRNLALRLIALGYKNVFWYRGGWEAASSRQRRYLDKFLRPWLRAVRMVPAEALRRF
jgi:hypothetical protein